MPKRDGSLAYQRFADLPAPCTMQRKCFRTSSGNRVQTKHRETRMNASYIKDPATQTATARALEGVKVVEMGQLIAGPFCGKT
ncbi:MAG: CoA transferase, partial [Comamonas sp.]